MRANPTFRSGKLALDYDHVETRGVLAGAYLPRHHEAESPSYLTHLVFIGPAPRYSELRTGCRQPVDHIGDVYGVTQEESAARPTCPTCAKKWEKIPVELRGAPRERYREPNARSRRDQTIRREIRKAAERTPGWKPSSRKAYISDLALEVGMPVAELEPYLVELNREIPGGILSRLDLVSAADREKLRRSTIETGVFGGAQLVDLAALSEREPNARVLDRLLDQVTRGKREVTLDVEGYTREQVEQVIAAARSRGFDVSGTDRWLLIRDLGRNRIEEREPNGGYYVWVIGKDGHPLLEGPYGPHELTKAKQLARIGATAGKHNRAVSRGVHPTDKSFEIVREYEAGSGERLL